MKIMVLLDKIWHWLSQPFQNILTAAEKAFSHLAQNEQLALERASSFVAVLTQIEKVTPDIAFTVLNKISPGLSKQRFESLLDILAKALSVNDELVGTDIETTLQNIVTYLNKYKDKNWVVIVQSAVGFVLSAMTPEGTVIEKLLLCLQHVYTNIVNKKIAEITNTK